MPGWEALRRAAGLLQPHEAALRRPAAAAAAARPYHGRTSGSGGGAFAASAFWGPSSRQLPSLQPDAPLPPQQILPPKPWGLCQASTVHEPCRFRAEAPKDGEASCSDRALHMQKLRQEALHSAVSHQRGKGGDAVACQEFHQLLVELGIPEFRAQHLVERLSSSARGIPEVESTARPVLEFLRARDIKVDLLGVSALVATSLSWGSPLGICSLGR